VSLSVSLPKFAPPTKGNEDVLLNSYINLKGTTIIATSTRFVKGNKQKKHVKSCNILICL
jgi:hypothetical protein